MIGPSVVVLFTKKYAYLTETDRCAGALSCMRNQLLVLHFSLRFLLTASLRPRGMLMYISLFTVAQFLYIITTNFWDFWKALGILFATFALLNHLFVTLSKYLPKYLI